MANSHLRAPAPPIGQWQHVAITLSGNTARLYTNGILATNGTITIAPASFNPMLNYLGKSQYAGDPLFNGRLDELFIYNHALGDAEITRLVANQPPPTAPTRISISFTGNTSADVLAGELSGIPARIELRWSRGDRRLVHDFRFRFNEPDVDSGQLIQFERLFPIGLSVAPRK